MGSMGIRSVEQSKLSDDYDCAAYTFNCWTSISLRSLLGVFFMANSRIKKKEESVYTVFLK